MTFDHRKLVTSLVREAQSETVVEIGVLRGNLSKMLWSVPTVKRLILVDPMKIEAFQVVENGETIKSREFDRPGGFGQEDLEDMYKNVISRMPKHVEYLRMTSLEAAESLEDNSIDLVFLDALHFYENAVADIRAWLPKIKDGGIYSGDDMTKRFPGIEKAVKETLPGYAHYGRVWWASVRGELPVVHDPDNPQIFRRA